MKLVVTGSELDYPFNVLQQIYSALDPAMTLGCFEALASGMDEGAQYTYFQDMATSEVAMVMQQRGIAIDPRVQQEIDNYYSRLQDRFRFFFEEMTDAIFGVKLTYNKVPGPAQLNEIFYKRLRLEPIYKTDYKTKERRVTTDREALEALLIKQPLVAPLTRVCLSIRDVNRKREAAAKGVDADGRLRCSYGVSILETGRWNSRPNIFGGGLSFHTITNEIRRMFVADQGYALVYIDLQSAESYATAFAAKSPAYKAACRSGDIHTFCSRLCWPELNWTGDLKKDKIFASDTKFYRHFSYRDMAKRGGHLTNYVGTARTMAAHLHISVQAATEFQQAYFNAFPEIPKWHSNVGKMLKETGVLTTPFGRRRQFYGRRNDNKTLREAVACEPQSVVADAAARGIRQIYEQFDRGVRIGAPEPHILCLAHVHDAGLFGIPLQYLDTLVPAAMEAMLIPIPYPDETLTIPCDAQVGFNWAKVDPGKKLFADGNPGGLLDWEKHHGRGVVSDNTSRIYV